MHTRKEPHSNDCQKAEIERLKSELQKTQEELNHYQKKLETIEKLYDAAFYSSAQLASISDLETGRFLDVNDAWVHTRGISRDEAIGKTADELNIWGEDPTYRQKIISDIEKTGRLRDYETQSIVRDGSKRDFILNAEVLEVDGKNLLFFSGVDITERKQINKNQQHSQKLEAIGQLSGGIAHDFNNLLGIIQGNLELMQERVDKNDPLQGLLASAIHGAHRGAKITRKLLSFSSKQASGREVINANDVISSMKDLIAKSVTSAIQLETLLDEDLWPVDVDPGDLEDAIINLSLNAHDAMPDGGHLSIMTENVSLDETYTRFHETVEPGDYVAIRIRDTGCGLPEDVRDRIFEPFFTTKEKGRGTGLGLSMIFGFIQRSNGHISVDSKPGEGCLFSLYLPRVNQSPLRAHQRGETSAIMPKGSETILVVDDEPSLVNLARQKLENLGYTVYTAFDGSSALFSLEDFPEIEIMFSDVVMPGELNGFQLAIKALELRPDLKIQLTSGYSKMDELLGNIHDSRIEDLKNNILPKPYSGSMLAQAIRSTADKEA
nr:ATP-binding protein [Sneathiella limimaris]